MRTVSFTTTVKADTAINLRFPHVTADKKANLKEPAHGLCESHLKSRTKVQVEEK